MLRIVTFEKKSFQALVEFSHASQAANALAQLEGKEIFQGCNLLRISYSKTPAPLKIVENNHRARDFTLPQYSQAQTQPGYIAANQYGGETQYAAAEQNAYNPYAAAAPTQGYGAQAPATQGFDMPGCVLLVNGLVEGVVTVDILFTLFGVYGDVLKVKIMWKNKTMAMVELATPEQAGRAKQYLEGVELYGSPLSVSMSKHAHVSVPNGANTEPSALAKDFTGSQMHRFKRAGSKNDKHVSAPSQSLHLSGLPGTVTVEDIQTIFADLKIAGEPYIFGSSPTKKMAIVPLSSVGDAIHALVTLHGSDFQGNSIRATFAHARRGQE